MAVPGIVGTTTGGVELGGSNSGSVTLTLPPGSTSYLAVAMRANGAGMTAPAGWTLVGSGENANDPLGDSWAGWSVWVGGSTAGNVFAVNSNSSSGSYVSMAVVGFNTAVSATGLATTSFNSDSSGWSGTSPSISTVADSYAARFLIADTYSGTAAVAYPTAATFGRVTSSFALSFGDRLVAALAFEERVTAGASGTGSWSVSGATSYYPVTGTLQVLDVSAPAPVTGSLAAALPKVTGSLAEDITVAGALSATLPLPTGALGTFPPFLTTVSGRRFLDQYGQPYLVRGDSPWGLMQNVSVADAKLYLDMMEANGFNLALTQFVGGPDSGATNSLAAHDGVQAFTNLSDWDTVNETFWARVDEVVAYAATKGITLLITPLFHGYSDGAASVLSAQPATKQTHFGTFIGTRYASSPNVVFSAGGDWDPSKTSYEAMWNRVIDATKAAAPDRLWTAQYLSTGTLTTISSSVVSTGSRADFEFAYSYPAAYKILRNPTTQAIVRPLIFGEGNYEGENNWGGPSTTAETVRRTIGWALSSGTQGDILGTSFWAVTGSWKTSLPSTAMSQAGAMRDAMASREWWALRPSSAFITSGAGTDPSSGSLEGGGVDPLESDYATASLSEDGTAAALYLPASRALSVNLGMLGPNPSAVKVDPASGAESTLTITGGSIAAPGTNSVGDDDWLYLFTADEQPTITGTLAAGLHVTSGSLTGSASVAAAVGGALPAVVGATSGQVTIGGATSGGLPAASGSVAGSVSIAGSVSTSVPAVTGGLLGAVVVTGATTGVLPALTSSLMADGLIGGALAADLVTVTADLAGAVSITGALTTSLPGASSSIAGSVVDPENITGSLSTTLPALSGQASGALSVSGSLSTTLQRVTASLADVPLVRELTITGAPHGHPFAASSPRAHSMHASGPHGHGMTVSNPRR